MGIPLPNHPSGPIFVKNTLKGDLFDPLIVGGSLIEPNYRGRHKECLWDYLKPARLSDP